MKKTTWPGNWKVACDVCDQWYASSEIKKRWDGRMVCPHDYEARHPATTYNYKTHVSVPDFIRKSAADTFLPSCDPNTILPRVGWGAVGCFTLGLKMEPDPYLHNPRVKESPKQ